MKAESTEIAEQIQIALQAVSPGNGYLTELGASVHRGFYSHVFADDDTVFPAAVIHPAVEVPSTVRADIEAVIASEIVLVIGAKLGVGPAGYDQIQACLRDTRRALIRAMPQITAAAGRDEIELGAAEPDLSKDSSLVLYAMAVQIKFNEQYQTG